MALSKQCEKSLSSIPNTLRVMTDSTGAPRGRGAAGTPQRESCTIQFTRAKSVAL